MKPLMLRAASVLWLFGLLANASPASEPGKQGTWKKLADVPKDVAGRESPPGTDGAWVYVPEWKGFLLYGGSSPTYSNEGWFFDPDKRAWTVLWTHDTLAKSDAGWRVQLPRDVVWSLDRPGPARAHGVAYVPQRRQVVFFGGHPSDEHSRHFGPDPRLTRESWLGGAKLGTWTLDPASGQFRHVTETGPKGITRGVYDPVNQLIVAMPVLKGPYEKPNEVPQGITWVHNLATGKWEARTSPDGPRPYLYSGFVYDSKVKRCIYFNGYGETWTYDAGKDVWTEKKPTTSAPPRRHAAMCYDEARGVTILHGGVHHAGKGNGGVAFSIHASHNGIHLADTWCYDAVKNEWTELKPTASPPKLSTARDLAAYDSDRKQVVIYDVATGVWALRSSDVPGPQVKATLPAAVVQAAAYKARAKPAGDPAVKAWQEKLRNLPDNTWLDLSIPMPAQGCMNIAFDPVNHCLVMLGGCGGAMFATPDDNSYNNQVWLLDMQVGKYGLRRAHHVWGPQDKEYHNTRLGPGCTRGNCFDSVRNVIWTAGGNGWSGVGTHWLQSYDVAADRFSPAGPTNPWGGGESGMFVHDPKNDLLVYMDGRRQSKTWLYNPNTKTYDDGGGVPPAVYEGLAMFCTRAYDPELGVIAVVPAAKDWKVGDPKPFKADSQPELKDVALRTFTYDAKTRQWRDLAPKNQEQLPFSGMPGVAYDSRNRTVLVLKSEHGDYKPLDTTTPFGTLWALDLASNTWKQAAAGPEARLNMASMTYDPKLNLVVCRFSHTRLWVYRYKGGCPAEAFGGQ